MKTDKRKTTSNENTEYSDDEYGDDDGFFSEYSDISLGALNNTILDKKLENDDITSESDIEEEIWDTIQFIGLSNEKNVEQFEQDTKILENIDPKQHGMQNVGKPNENRKVIISMDKNYVKS